MDIVGVYRKYMYDLADPRVISLPLLETPYLVGPILIFYLYFVRDYGARFMAHRKPYNLDYILYVYNAFQVIANFMIFATLLPYVIRFDRQCEPVNYSSEYPHLLITRCMYAYFVLKVVDLLDTVFFIMRKKTRQITFLHVYHHVAMVMISWWGIRYYAGGHACYLVTINALVHVVMYFYYLLTAYNKAYAQSLWWKKYLTQLQLAQFVVCFYLYTPQLFDSTCTYSKLAAFLSSLQSIVFFTLFSNFYYHSYIKTKKVQATTASPSSSSPVSNKTK